ncbi:MAG: transposase [Bradymonadaceae bacterium]
MRGFVMLIIDDNERQIVAFPLRIQYPGMVVLVSNRCFDQKMLMQPNDPQVSAIILGCLARAVAIHRVEVIGYVFMGNHFHLILRVFFGNLGDFMRDFQSWLAIKLKAYRGLDTCVFPERYKPVDLLDDEKAFEKLIYTLLNPCAAHLVDHPEEYPGLSSLQHHLEGGKVRGRWVDQERYTRNKKRNPNYDIENAVTYHEFELTPLPQMKDWTMERRRKTFMRALEKGAEKIRVERESAPVLGVEGIKALSFETRPKNPKFSKSSACVSFDREKIAEHWEHRRRVTDAYYKAKKKDHDPQYTGEVRYPPGTIPPGRSKSIPFSKRDLKNMRLPFILVAEERPPPARAAQAAA